MQVFVATTDGLWAVHDGAPERLLPRSAEAVHHDGKRWWAIVGDTVLSGADDGGSSVAATAPAGAPSLTCLVTDGERLLVGTAGAHLLEARDGVLETVASFEHAEGRAQWTTPWGGPPDTRSLAVDDRGRAVVNIHVGGVSREEGDRWVPLLDIDVDVHEVVTAPDGVLLAATGASGLAASHDDGATFDFVTSGFHGTYLRAVALTDSWIFVSASGGPFSHDGRIYRIPRHDVHDVQPVGGGLPAQFDGNVDSGWIAATGHTVAVATPDGALYWSGDEGVTWEEVASGLGRPMGVAIGSA